ncbi:MAG TPA: peptidylprolyl isomerase [Thermodesulfobacteriota bacterium]|nr:peptidylprolyl isomerase [Thermodesulfobacteriota bacterium]
MSLELLRRSQSWFTRGVLIILAITFVFGFGFSISNFGTGGSVPQGTAAEVNGEKIPLLEFYRARERLYKQYRQQGEIPEWAFNFIARGALDQLIDFKLLSQKAKELGFRVTDEELNEAIVSNPAFQVDGQFIGAEAYRAFVEQAFNQSVGEFEDRYREELLVQKLLNFMNETAKITNEELLNLFKMENERINLYFVSFSSQEFMDSFSPSEEDIKKYYEEHKADLKSPELRSIRYITVTSEDFNKGVEVSEDEILAYYNAYPDEFRSEDNEIRPVGEVREEIKKKLKKQREGVKRAGLLSTLEKTIIKEPLDKIAESSGIEKVRNSKPFSPTDSSSDLPAQVIERAFAIEPGQKTFFQVGDDVWIIELAEVIPPREKEFKEVKEEIRSRIQSMRAKETAREKAQELLNKARTNGGGLDKLAQSQGLDIEETGFFSRLEDVPGVGADDLRIEAFLLHDKNPLASKVYVVDDKFYVVSLKEKQEVNLQEFDEKKAELKEKALSQRRRDLYSEWIQKLRQESKIVVNENLFTPQG